MGVCTCTPTPTPTLNNSDSAAEMDIDKNELFGEFENSSEGGLSAYRNKDDLAPGLVKTASLSGGFFKHQQKDESDLSVEEKANLSRELLKNKPATFVERFGKYLSEEQLEYFEEMRSDNYELEFYLKQARQEQCRFIKGHKVKNRRYAAMQKMLNGNDDHFSETAMKARNPLLHEQLVGRFMTEEEKEEKERPDMSNCSLTNIILEHMDLNKERDDKKKLKEEEDEEEFDTDEDESNDEEEEEGLGRQEGGREFLKQQFVKAAYQSFLEGKDDEVDYRKIDNDGTLDDLDVEQRDAEEKYFDDSDNDE